MFQNFCNSQRVRITLTIIGVVILVFFLIKYALQGRWELFWADTIISILGVGLFNLLWTRLRQDNVSYLGFLILLTLHVAYLYPHSILGVPWDHYMHFIGGGAIALIADRMFAQEKHWGMGYRALIIILVAMGVGAIHEVIEWMGYAYLGEGEGWLFYGEGDEGAWQNAMLDMMFNFFGATLVALTQSMRRAK